jgi:hypothetical protein
MKLSINRNITPKIPPKPATSTVRMLMGISTEGIRSTMKRSMNPRIMFRSILKRTPPTLKRIISPKITIRTSIISIRMFDLSFYGF